MKAKMSKTKLYCYVDETGQDGLHKFFLVSVVITNQAKKDELEKQLETIEQETGKNKLKWTKTKTTVRKNFIKEVGKLQNLKNAIFYSMYPDGKANTSYISFCG